jgi:hypothetical protein
MKRTVCTLKACRSAYLLGSTLLSIVLGVALATSDSSAQTTAVPDFSGTWARQSFGFERPSMGPGPIENLEHRPSGIGSNLNKLVGDYKNPILKPEAAERVKRLGEISQRGNAFPDPSNQCHPQPAPYGLAGQRHVRILQKPDRITILYEQDQQVRHIYMNERHPANLRPSWFGHSIGRFEGDTLIVDTVGFKVGPLSMVDAFGTPHSDALHLVERFRLVDYDVAKAATELAIKEPGYAKGGLINEGVVFDAEYMGKGLQVEFTVDDEKTFTTRWGAAVTYRRSASTWLEYTCAENTFEYYANKDTAIPVANAPDF